MVVMPCICLVWLQETKAVAVDGRLPEVHATLPAYAGARGLHETRQVCPIMLTLCNFRVLAPALCMTFPCLQGPVDINSHEVPARIARPAQTNHTAIGGIANAV